MVLGGAVDEDVLGLETFRKRGKVLEFADNFNRAVLLAPPSEQGSQRLGLAREPVPDGQVTEVCVEFCQRFPDGFD